MFLGYDQLGFFNKPNKIPRGTSLITHYPCTVTFTRQWQSRIYGLIAHDAQYHCIKVYQPNNPSGSSFSTLKLLQDYLYHSPYQYLNEALPDTPSTNHYTTLRLLKGIFSMHHTNCLIPLVLVTLKLHNPSSVALVNTRSQPYKTFLE